MAYAYPNRDFAVPLNWTVPYLVTDVITNNTLNNLYYYFTCSAGQITNENTQAQKRGIVNPLPESLWYIQQGIYCLRNWYNGGFTFGVPSNFGAGYTSDFYWQQSITGNDTSVPLVTGVQHGSNLAAFIVNLQLALPEGYTVKAINSNTQIYIQTVNAATQFLWGYTLLNGNPVGTGFVEQIDFWSCISYGTMQNIVQNLTKLCQCPNCGNTVLLETDNIYTSLSLPIPNPVSMFLTSYENQTYN